MNTPATVQFVGAGPGDPDLLTLRALKALRAADIVLYDALVGDAVLDLIPARAKRISVGKRAHGTSVPQAEINRLLVRLAQPGKKVVRLKGGDPAIFARLGEEIAALKHAGIRFEIVPGITAASAAAAACGIPLTLRGAARRVQFVTAHTQKDSALNLDWQSLADPSATTVFYMARASASQIAHALIAHGLSACTPLLVVSDVSLGSEKRLRTHLEGLPQAVMDFPPQVPLVILVGEVAEDACLSRANHTSARAALCV